jgi:ElaB/YqjD/DUF883 family membrane-anchored ribosome-binding protein
MTKPYFFPAIALSVLLLTGCAEPKMPQDVAEVFWQSVIAGDAGEVVEHSTLADKTEFDGYSQNWEGVTFELGRVIIDNRRARVVTRFTGLNAAGEKSDKRSVETATHLLEVNDEWLVDYQGTGEALAKRPVFEELIEELENFGDKVKEGLSSKSESAGRKIEEMAKEFEQLSDLAGERLSELSDKYGKELKQSIEELSRSIEDALKEKDSAPSKEDKQTLHEAALDRFFYNGGSS